MLGYLDSDDAVSLDDIWDKMYQVALGLQYLHDRNIIHGTLSAYTVAIASNGVAKLHVFDGASGGVLPWRSAPEILAGLPASFKSDMFAFGLVIIEAIKRGARMWGPLDDDDAIISGKLPKKPDDMTANQWNLVERMCCYDYRERLSASDVVRELEGIISRKTLIRELVSDMKALNAIGETIGWTNIGELWMGECTLSSLLHEIDEMCGGSMTIDKMNRDVYDRLIDIYNQLHTTSGDLVQDVIQQYGNVVNYFHSRLHATSAVGSAQAARFAASRQGADDTFSVHKDVDQFAESAGLSLTSQIHQWREQWELRHRQQKSDMLESLENLSTLLEDVTDEKEREEALIHLRFELSKHPTSYATSKAADFIHAKSTIAPLSSSIKNPSWFIPAHEVHFDKFDEFSRGAFGKVYHGQWKRSQVVVKKVKLRNGEDQAVFLKEVEIWHKLYHPNVVQLYGACHIQKPFFVCEFASNGQLDVFLRSHPDQVWEKLYEAALGLRYLHMKHIVHGDLKCNNILVGSDGKAKLTDFGLSVMDAGKAEPEAETEIASDEKVSIGAMRWKAPEVICGEKATFASDVYSFGMCVLESVSGKFPWGMMMDPVVKYYVVKLKRIPERPANCIQDAYALVERMCRFEPSKRMQMNQVVDALKALR